MYDIYLALPVLSRFIVRALGGRFLRLTIVVKALYLFCVLFWCCYGFRRCIRCCEMVERDQRSTMSSSFLCVCIYSAV